jgi:hyperosmotically inducible protein
MKLFSKKIVLLAAVLAVSFIGANAQSNSTDARPLSVQIEKKLANMPYYEVFDYISFDIQVSTVYLNGKVLNGMNKSMAENIVKDLPGVEKVVNNIEILPAGGLDNSIRRELLRSITNRGGLARYVSSTRPSVRIIVDRGRISLEGYVANSSDADALNVLANGTSGAFGVSNNLVVNKEKL